MNELRWILVGLGAFLIVGLYLWGRKPFGDVRLRFRKRDKSRAEPRLEEVSPPESSANKPRPRRSEPERVVTLRIVRRDQDEINAADAVLALKRVGLVHGQYGIFHSVVDRRAESPRFSVASLTEPGSFDLSSLDDEKIAGLSVFMVLPGMGDPVDRFDAMVSVARGLADDLDGHLLDERGSSWSIQRERYVREEIIRYRHQHGQV